MVRSSKYFPYLLFSFFSFFSFSNINREISTLLTVLISKCLGVVIIFLLFELTLCQAKMHFLGWSMVNAVCLHILSSFRETPLSKYSVLNGKLHSN